MKILFISISWPAPGVRNLYTDLMDEFRARGEEVFVLATGQGGSPPSIPEGGFSPGNEQRESSATRRDHFMRNHVKGGIHDRVDGITGNQKREWLIGRRKKFETALENGIRVLRVYAGPIRKVSPVRKGLSLLGLGARLAAALRRAWPREAFDLVIAPTPPVTLSGLFRKVKRRYGAPFYLLLKDVWPQGSVDLGVLHRYGLPWCWLRFHELRTYRVADYVGCMSPRGVAYFRAANPGFPSSRVEECPNSIRPSRVEVNDQPLLVTTAGGTDTIRRRYAIPEEACLFVFSGNLGIGHGLSFLTEVIKQLAEYREAFFLVGGSGTCLARIRDDLNGSQGRNALVYSWLPEADFHQLMETSDVGLILLHRYTVPQFPSRLLTYFDHSKAVLCAVNKHTDIGEIVERHGCGLSVPHGDVARFTQAVRYLATHREARREMGQNGHRLLLGKYTVAGSYDIIMSHFRN
ncbi:MAG TPA: glycosyltransferase family 4 protein [Prolixibacteraceae bacterium]|nr:glycosyltransferase family 4 protein [Prolixibacteraceae bacterium]